MRKEVIRLHLYSKIFFFTLHVFIISAFIIYHDSFRIKKLILHWKFIFSFFILVFLETYAFLICGNKPGYVNQEKVFITDEEDRTDKEVPLIEDKSTLIGESNNSKNILHFSSINYICRFCSLCKMVQPLRTKHCKECEACVAKYDHHCFWLGSCIGELNLRKFWIMLSLQVITYSLMFYLSILGLNQSQVDLVSIEPSTSNSYGTFVLTAIISFSSSFFVAALWILTTYSILTNQTSWEQTSRAKITYLQEYSEDFHPFHKSFLNNIKQTFFHKGELNKWEIDYSLNKNFYKNF